MRFDIMTLFPEVVESVLGSSIIGRARERGVVEIVCHNIRDYTEDKHRRVDDYPYGGGMGMIMQVQPICRCFDAIRSQLPQRPHVIYLSPQGQVLTQKKVLELSKLPFITLLCGHYEGVDERAVELIVDEEISIGDYVLTGGEIPAMALADAVCRMIPGVLSEPQAFEGESHFNGLLEYPQYTRPPVYQGKAVPEVLLGGHHANIEKWRRAQSLLRTLKRRPDMLEKAKLSQEDKAFLKEHANSDRPLL
jgi:tRNA (guanine37-N1)-methyltransferase